MVQDASSKLVFKIQCVGLDKFCLVGKDGKQCQNGPKLTSGEVVIWLEYTWYW